MAAAVDKRLTFEAKKLPHDGRTLAQRRADLFVSWLTNNEHGEPAVKADVAVVIPAGTLAGCSAAPAVAADGSFIVPALWITGAKNHLVWHSILTGKGRNVLETRFHGVCQAPTCTTPADQCESDDQGPWPLGETNGANIGPLCPRHHQVKSHGIITLTLPSGQARTTEPVDHRHSIDIISHLENELALVVDLAA